MSLFLRGFIALLLTPSAFADAPHCPITFPLNPAGTACEMSLSMNGCDAGNGNEPASIVSNNVSGFDPVVKFNSVVNKKLACCLNEFGSVGSPVKFDCVQPIRNYRDFNELWSASDPITDGGQINAILMVDSNGNPVSGFYGLNGVRCSEFSEFGGDIVPAKIDPALVSDLNSKNEPAISLMSESAIPLPGTNATFSGSGNYSFQPSSAAAYQMIRNQMNFKGKIHSLRFY